MPRLSTPRSGLRNSPSGQQPRGRDPRLAGEISGREIKRRKGGKGGLRGAEIPRHAGVRFEIKVTPVRELRPDGADEVEFLISANPGESPMPLSK